jgi:hypothetical protein
MLEDRGFTDVRLGQAVAKQEMGLPESWVTFWMGHHGDIESIYRHKRTLSDSQLEQMRALIHFIPSKISMCSSC